MKQSRKKSLILPMALLVVGVFAIVVGATRGEALVVLDKAVKICLECIGIG